jgi:hypothetical protein
MAGQVQASVVVFLAYAFKQVKIEVVACNLPGDLGRLSLDASAVRRDHGYATSLARLNLDLVVDAESLELC